MSLWGRLCRFFGHEHFWRLLDVRRGPEEPCGGGACIPQYHYYACACGHFLVCLGGPCDAKVTGRVPDRLRDKAGLSLSLAKSYTPGAWINWWEEPCAS